MEEVVEALNSCNGNKTRNLDGFPIAFFQHNDRQLERMFLQHFPTAISMR